MKFTERLKYYKAETDYFIVDVWKTNPCISDPYETKHDLTYKQARNIYNKAKQNEKISRVEIWVEDWEQTESDEDYCENLFALVDVLEKVPCKWNLHPFLNTRKKSELYKYPCAWKVINRKGKRI